LCNDIHQWVDATNIGKRPVTTVHFGGGSPNCIAASLFERIMTTLHECLNCTPETEWALETTGDLLSIKNVRLLLDAGFSRLHVGVQTLNDDLRLQLGRVTNSAQLLGRMKRTQELGAIVSTDVIYGLPGQTMNSLHSTITQLTQHNFDGISLYRLNLSHRNLQFKKAYANSLPGDQTAYKLFNEADSLLLQAGYAKNHFTHYARPTDRHLYFLHAVRREDLLALGASANGIFANCHYRMSNYHNYHHNSFTGRIDGSYILSPAQQHIEYITARIMANQIRRHELEQAGGGDLLRQWKKTGLIADSGDDNTFALTASGSWWIAFMLQELRAHLYPVTK